jgi:hypothetical protein
MSNAEIGRTLGRFGLAVLVLLVSLSAFALTAIFPPWLEVRCQRRMILYFSEQKQIYESSFAGFDYLFATRKWNATWTPPGPSPGENFDSQEFNVCWSLLFFEWLPILATAFVCDVRLSRRLFEPPVAKAVNTAEDKAAELPSPESVELPQFLQQSRETELARLKGGGVRREAGSGFKY